MLPRRAAAVWVVERRPLLSVASAVGGRAPIVRASAEAPRTRESGWRHRTKRPLTALRFDPHASLSDTPAGLTLEGLPDGATMVTWSNGNLSFRERR